MIVSTRAVSLFLFNKLSARNISFSQILRSNYYETLGLTSSATQEEIKNAFFKLSKKFHPDLNNNSEESTRKFQEITAAYEILGNEKTRKEYDGGNFTFTTKIYRKRDIDERIFRASFHKKKNVDPWDTERGQKKQQTCDTVAVKRKFSEETEHVKEDSKVLYNWIWYLATICLSVIIGSIFPYFDLRTEFVEEQVKQEMKYANDKSDNSKQKVVYFFKYSG